MKHLLFLLQIVCLLSAVNGKTSMRRGAGPQYGTAAKMTSATSIGSGISPEPTAGPDEADLRKRSEVLEKRAGETCGYINGQSIGAVSCVANGGECIYNSVLSVIGCCASAQPTDCNIYTTCLPRTSSVLAAQRGPKTLYCSDADTPSCAELTYADPEWYGYRMQLCYAVQTTFPIYASTFGSRVTVMPSESTTTTQVTPPSSTSPVLIPVTATLTPTLSPSPTQPPNPKPQVPVGAIVGGSVGGVLGLALIGLLALFVFRKKKSSLDQGAADQQPVAMHDNAAALAAPGNNRESTFKPGFGTSSYPVSPSSSYSPPGSPPPVYPTNIAHAIQSPSQQQYGPPGEYQPYVPPRELRQLENEANILAHEMPNSRAQRDIRELPS